MASSQSYHDYVIYDLLADINGITSKKMFGGFGFYYFGKIFAIIADDELYFKVGPENQADFKKLNSQPFTYTFPKTGKTTTMPYWKLPAQIIEDPELLEKWIKISASIKLTTNRKSFRKGVK